MIELVELKEGIDKYHGDDEDIHRIQLHIKIKDPTDKETAALHSLVTDFLKELGVKKNE